MADMKKDDPTKTAGTGESGAGAKISAGSSVGTAGTPPKPPGMSTSGAGSSTPSGDRSNADNRTSSSGSTTGGTGSPLGAASGMTTGGQTTSAASSVGGAAGSGLGSAGGGSTGAMGSGSGSSGGMGSAGGLGAGSTGAGSQSSTLASHTSRPMGGTGGAGASSHGTSQGPEHTRHQDRSAQPGGQAGGSGQGGGTEDLIGEAQERVGEAYETAKEWASDAYERARDYATGAYDRGSRQYGSTARYSRPGATQAWGSTQRFINENPVLVGVIGLAAGLLLGALLPRTRQEDRTFGEWSDEVRNQGVRYAREATRMGREYAEQAFSDDDPRYAQHESEWRRGPEDDEAAQAARRTSPIAGRYQNH